MRLIKLFLICLFALMASVPAQASDVGVPNGVSANQIDYLFVGHLNITDDEGRLLVWEGVIDGDISGDMKWWFGPPPVDTGGPPGFPLPHEGGGTSYYQARWEILQDGQMVLAGESAGKTVFSDGEDAIWDGHGVVTKAKGQYNRLKGRKIYESGPVWLGDFPPLTYEGRGIFTIY